MAKEEKRKKRKEGVNNVLVLLSNFLKHGFHCKWKSVDSRESSQRDRHPTSLASSTKVGGRGRVYDKVMRCQW